MQTFKMLSNYETGKMNMLSLRQPHVLYSFSIARFYILAALLNKLRKNDSPDAF